MTLDKQRVQIIIFSTLIALLSFLSYINSIQNPFLFDDGIIIRDNPNIRNFGNLKFLFSPGYFEIFEERTWRPFTTFFYMINYKLWGLYAPMWKITSVSIHALNGIFLYLALRRKYAELVAFFAGALFVSLPVNSEVVNSIAFIKDSLSLFFGLITFMFFIKGYFLLSFFAFLVSLLSKEMAAILPLLLILYDMTIEEYRWENFRTRIKTIHVWYWIILLIFLVIYFGRFSNAGDDYFGGGFSIWLLNLPMILIKDIGLLFSIWPNVDRVVEPSGIGALFAWIPIILITLIIAIIWYKEKPFLFLFLWLILCLVPISGIVPLDQVIAERFLYWSSFGFSGIIAITFFRLLNKHAALLLIVVVLFFIAIDFKRSNDWKDNLSLWSATVRDEHRSFRGHANLAIAYSENGMVREAINEMKTAISIKPDYASAYNTLGYFYFSINDYVLAEDNFKKAIELKPTMAEAYNNIAMVVERRGDRGRAIALLKKAIELKPGYHLAISNLAKLERE